MGKIIRNGIEYTNSFDVAIVALPFSDSKTYQLGEYVIFNHILYVANKNISSPGSFNINEWNEIILADELYEINNRIKCNTIKGNGWILNNTGHAVILSLSSFNLVDSITDLADCKPSDNVSSVGLYMLSGLVYNAEIVINNSGELLVYYYDNNVKKIAATGTVTGQICWVKEA